jgi:hypothetical protein
MSAIDRGPIDAKYEKVDEAIDDANKKTAQSLASYDAAIAAIRASNTDRADAMTALGVVETTVSDLRDTAGALLDQKGDLPPEIPEPEPAAPVAPIKGMRGLRK